MAPKTYLLSVLVKSCWYKLTKNLKYKKYIHCNVALIWSRDGYNKRTVIAFGCPWTLIQWKSMNSSTSCDNWHTIEFRLNHFCERFPLDRESSFSSLVVRGSFNVSVSVATLFCFNFDHTHALVSQKVFSWCNNFWSLHLKR